MTTLFDPIHIGHIEAANRIVMAPLTRNRAGAGQVPTDLMTAYYEQRASAGLIVTEATQISQTGQGYLDTPGIYDGEQIRGWRGIADAVHAKGGKLVMQLWHVGRISHTSLQPGGQAARFEHGPSRKCQDFHRQRLRRRLRATGAAAG